MTLTFRPAIREDVPAIVALLADDHLGNDRETAPMDIYLTAFDRIASEGDNELIVGVDSMGAVQATYQITYTTGLSLAGTRRATVEGVRVARPLRGTGRGRAMLHDAETRASAAGCGLIQLAMNTSRTESHRFYEAIGFTPSHIGFKRYLK